MTSVNMEVASMDVAKKTQKHAWYDRRWSLFSSRKVSKQNSKKRKELPTSSEIVSTVSNESSKSVQISSDIGELADVQKDSTTNIAVVSTSTSLVECLLCLTSQPADEFPIVTTCQHQTCINCLRQYLKVEITESRVNLTCPACQEKLLPSDVVSILQGDSDLLSKWEEFLLRRVLSTDPDCRWCPAPDCGFAVIAYGCASCPKIVCQRPGCNTEFCYHCRQEWHNNQTCDSAYMQRTRKQRWRTNSGAYSQGSTSNDEIKPCPKCGAFIVKMNDGSCNHMTCTVCDAEFCWLCLQEITDLHYLSPSGCTFWGKKPWSKKKKVLWQLGLLIGAPLGIALIAGVAVPAIMIGLPVWVGKKVASRLRKRGESKHRKNFAVLVSVSASIILSPALAGLAVAIGVPIMLLYVYGVVPFSLYRTGSTNGVKGQQMTANVAAMLPAGFRLDNTNSAGVVRSLSQEETGVFHPRSNRTVTVNPSIEEGSVGAMTMGSLNMSHSSNLDKVGRGDQDGASTMAMAGTSITGSISGISAAYNHANRGELLFKDTDQHSIQTHMSVASNATGFTSVQIHVTDNVSLHSSASVRSSSRPPFSKRNGSSDGKSFSYKRTVKSKSVKNSSLPSSSDKTQDGGMREDGAVTSLHESSCVLTIVDETSAVISESEPIPDNSYSTSDADQKEAPDKKVETVQTNLNPCISVL